MNITMESNVLDLRRGQLLRIQDAQGTRLVCTRGELWVTQDNDLDDHFIEPGDSLLLDRPGLVIVSAFHDSGIEIEVPPPDPDPLDFLPEFVRQGLQGLGADRARIAIQ